MPLAAWATAGFLALSCVLALAWLWQGWSAGRGMPALPDLTGLDLDALPALSGETGPQLTVIVPACNEAQSIEASLRSLLGSAGIRLEILADDDRSTDATGAIMDRLAAENAAAGGSHTLRVLHIRELPAGWLGKPHAMATAAAQAQAEWLLFTDGDVLFAPGALECAMRCAISQRADHFVLVPTLLVESLAERAVQAAMQVLAQWPIRLWKVADPGAGDFVGVGGFNLMRRAAYRAVGGFESMPMEVLDDLRIGWKLKRAGFAARVALGPDLVRIRWIEGALSVFSLIEKNSFAVFQFRSVFHITAAFSMLALGWTPPAAMVAGLLLSGSHGAVHGGLAAGLIATGALGWLGIAWTYAANRRLTQAPWWLALTFAPCITLVSCAFLRSMVVALWYGGIRWRGTFYPLKTLREQSQRW